jgi:hypothetical protein
MIKGWLRERLSSRNLKNDKATAHSIFSERGSGFQPR